MGRDMVSYRIDKTGAERKLRSLTRDLEKGGVESIEEVGEMGKQYARAHAPYYSGQTFRKIVLRRAKGGTEVVIGATNILNDGHTRRHAKFDLTRWMHQSTKARKHIYSGDPKFMYTTADYLRRTAPVTVRRRYDQLITKYR